MKTTADYSLTLYDPATTYDPVTIQEIFAFEPMSACDCLSGWSGKDNPVLKMMAAEDLTAGSDAAGSLLFINLQDYNPTEIIDKLESPSFLPGIVLFNAVHSNPEPRMLKYLEENKIPLFYTPLADAYIQAADLFGLLAGMKKSGRFTYFAQSSVYYTLKNIGYPGFIALLEHKVNNPVLILSSMAGQNGSPADQEWLHSKSTKLASLIYAQEREQFSADIVPGAGYYHTLILDNEEELAYFCLPLCHQGYHYGFMAVPEQNGPLSSMDKIYLEAAAKVVLEQFVNHRNLESIEKKHKADFIHDLLYNNFESKEDIVNRGSYWGFDLTLPYQLYVIEPDWVDKRISFTDLLDKVQLFAFEAADSTGCQPIIGQIQEQVVLIVPESYFKNKTISKENTFSLASALHRKLKKYLTQVSFAIGIGRSYPSVLDLARSFQEAKITLELGKLIYDKNHIAHFEDLGVVRLLASIDFLQLDDFYKEYLNDLILYDQQNETNLLETLMLYYKYSGDVNTVAQKMYVHPNSLRNRLKKIEELTHIDLKNYEDLLNLFVACKISSMKQN